jgi:hypothetical protein
MKVVNGEVFLYGCEGCNNVIYELRDRGDSYYVDQCPACKDWSDYRKIVIKPAYDMLGNFQGNRFAVEEEKDDSKDKSDNT